MPRITAIEEINGRLMVEIEKPSSDGICSILSKEETELQNAKNMNRLNLFDSLNAALSGSDPEYWWVEDAKKAIEEYRNL